MAIVERLKKESMYELSAKKKIAVVERWPLVEVQLYFRPWVIQSNIHYNTDYLFTYSQSLLNNVNVL